VLGEICGDIIAPNAEEVDHDGPEVRDGRVTYARGTQRNHEALVQAGLYGMSLPRRFDGLNFSMVPYVMAAEIVSRADAGFANIWGLQDCAETIHEFASEEIQQEFLPRINKGDTCSMDLTEPDAGSDLQAVMLRADWDEKKGMWLLNGVKRFITNGDAQIKLVLARSEEGTTDARGLSYFVYDKAWGGVRVRRIENKLGIKGSPTCELVFTNAPAKIVGDRRMGLIKYVMSLMNGARLGVGAQSVGLSEAAYREGLKYAHERAQFGKTIINFPAVYELLAVIKAKLQASRALLYETSRFVDIYKAYNFLSEDRKLTPEERTECKEYQRLADVYTPLLKLFSSEYANQNAYDSLQIHGGSGFMKEYPIERMYRDARILTIYEGTSQLQVVAAIRGVTTGAYLNRIRDYEKAPVKGEHEQLKKILVAMTAQYEQAVQLVVDKNDVEITDFHARRLVEMAGHIVMGYLLLLDAQRCSDFEQSAAIFITRGRAWNNGHFSFIEHFELDHLAAYSVKS
jgi:alkylation response protein AidB-like acyl-CoA dehydrogenase